MGILYCKWKVAHSHIKNYQFSMHDLITAPEFIVSKWLNCEKPLSLEALRGKVVMVVAFQMLCPGCAIEAIPQANKIFASFAEKDLAVIGLHTVFEHHAAMQEESLKAFLHEYKVAFPVAIDKPTEGYPIPHTMGIYQMQGTPTLLLIDRQGRLRTNHFGHVPDLLLGAELMKLILEKQE